LNRSVVRGKTYIEQELEKRIRLFIFQSDDASCETGVDVQSFLTSYLTNVRISLISTRMKTRTHRMYSDDRVTVPHRFSADKLAIPPGILSLSEAVVLGF
jgi:hypothetical protein